MAKEDHEDLRMKPLHRDPGDEVPEKIGKMVPRRYADAHDGEPAKTNMFHAPGPEKLGGPYDKTEEWDMKPKPPKGFTWDENEYGEPILVVDTTCAETLGEGVEGGGKRYNAGKIRMELIPPEWLWALADVLTKGAEKYDERNWEKGMGWSSMIGCIQRHTNKFLANDRYDGDRLDVEKGTTGCHHLAMVAWNALALMSYDLRQIGENDMPKEVQLELFDRVNAETSDLGGKVHGK